MQQILELTKTLACNLVLGFSTGRISDKYKTKITPTDQTFSIWGFIYINLTKNILNLDNELFIQSMRLNREWLSLFVKEDLIKSYSTIEKLKTVNIKLADQYHSNEKLKYILDVYATWVIFASALNELIVEEYIFSRRAYPKEKLESLLIEFKKSNLTNGQRDTIQWALTGIVKNHCEYRELVSLYFNIDLSKKMEISNFFKE